MNLRKSLVERIVEAYNAGRGYTWKDDNGIVWAFDHDRDLYAQGQCNTVRHGRIQRMTVEESTLTIEVCGGATVLYGVM